MTAATLPDPGRHHTTNMATLMACSADALEAGENGPAALWISGAHVAAQAAGAEEQRTANLIAWAQVRLARNLSIDELVVTIERRLGL